MQTWQKYDKKKTRHKGCRPNENRHLFAARDIGIDFSRVLTDCVPSIFGTTGVFVVKIAPLGNSRNMRIIGCFVANITGNHKILNTCI
jgi:hypothetical protein